MLQNGLEIVLSGILVCLLAMEWPSCWIILGPLKDNEGRCVGIFSWSDELNVSHLCIVGVGNDAIPITKTFGENVEVVTVKLQSC